MSLLSALLPPTLALNPSHPSSYHYSLLLTSSATLTAIIHSGTLTHRKTNQAKICLTGFFLLIFYLLTTPNITPYYTVPPETTPFLISLSLSLVPAQIASKCTWQTLPDLGSDHLPISIFIPTSPLINSIHRPPHSITIKLAGTITYIDTHCPPPSNFTTLSFFEATHTFIKLLNDAATSVIPFGNINRPAIKPGGPLKSQMPSRNAERHLQRFRRRPPELYLY